MTNSQLRDFLEEHVDRFNNPRFIEADPISIPHSYSSLKDIEITAFWTAILSWGRRETIISKAQSLFEMMDHQPADFIQNHSEKDLKKLLSFKHRTFLSDDTLYFVKFLKEHYNSYDSLEDAFLMNGAFSDVEISLNQFRANFFKKGEHLKRTEKHISSPFKKSTCKRLNMFLRWMVRKDKKGVDFGLWNRIPMSGLYIPYDVHVDRVGRQLGLIKRKQKDWKTVQELTAALQKFDPKDPIRYDFALFGIGVLDENI